MTQWIVCPACGLRHSRGPDSCPRCRSRAGSGAPGAAAAAPAAVAVGRPTRTASRAPRVAAIVGLIGLAVLGVVVRRVARYAGHAAMSHVHWRDPVLLEREMRLDSALAEARGLQQSLEGYRATAPEDRRALDARVAALARAAGSLDGVGATAGLELEERLPPRKYGNWTTISVRLRAGRDPSELIDAVARLALPEGAWVEEARCAGAGCSLVLSAATWQGPQRATTPLRPGQLPPRPWWPPSAAVWDRVHEAHEEYARVATIVNDLYPLKEVRDASTLLDLVTVTARSEKHRAVVSAVLRTALAAGITEVEVKRVAVGMHVSVPHSSAEFRSRLGKFGFMWEVAVPGPGTTYAVSFTKTASDTSDLPAGFSWGY